MFSVKSGGVGTQEQSYEADKQFEYALRLRTPVALATKRKLLYTHEYGVFGRDNALPEARG